MKHLKNIAVSALLTILVSNTAVSAGDGLVAWWKFDEVVKAGPDATEAEELFNKALQEVGGIELPTDWSREKKEEHQQAYELAKSLIRGVFLSRKEAVEKSFREGKSIALSWTQVRRSIERFERQAAEVVEEADYLRDLWIKLDEIFDRWRGKAVIESVSGNKDLLFRNYESVGGVCGKGLKFDGFSTYIIRKADGSPRLTEAFTVEVWVVPQAYPWNWCAIVNQEKEHRSGYFFGINAHGQVGLHLAVNGDWQECTSKERIAFMTGWSHIAGTFDKDRGITVYVNGREAARLAVKGEMTFASDMDLQIGRNHKAMPVSAPMGGDIGLPALYSFDGIIDELKIYNRALSSEEIAKSYKANKPMKGPPLEWRKMPEVPAGTAEFGARYTRLKFYKEWDNIWRVGDHPDVVVKFEDAPYSMTFWRGTNYNMNLVTEKGQWVGTQSVEAGGWDVIFDIPLFHKERVIGCTEHMSDKHCRYAHVRVIENTDARVVVHWRYALCDVLYQITDIDPVTGWGNWVDEYYTVYPDGAAVRSFIVHGLEWSGCDVTAPSTLNPPGKKAEDDLSLDAMSVANMAGESRTYSYRRGARNKILRDANILRLNLKARYKPFYIYEPGARIGPRPSDSEYSCFDTFNHWPVAQVPSWGRVPVVPDRVTSSEITAPYIPRERREGDEAIVGRYILGLTDKAVEELLPLAKSWIKPAELVVKSDGFSNEGYSRDERAYILRKGSDSGEVLEIVLEADKESPIVNPAFVIRNWGGSDADLRINGSKIKRGKNFRFGHRYTLESSDLVVWIKYQSNKPLQMTLSPVED